MNDFLLCFIPLFVAVDPVGILPLFMNLTERVDKARIRRVIVESVLTASAAALAFILLGKLILKALGITMADFMIAGGILLFALAMTDLLGGDRARRRVDPGSLGAVPLGVPLIVGPAVLTTAMLLVDQHGMTLTVTAMLLNIAITGAMFLGARFFDRILGKTGEKVISKLVNLLLAAIGVMLVRRGIETVMQLGG